MLSFTDSKSDSNFHFVCELLPFVKEGLFSVGNTNLTACAKTFQMLQFIHMVFRKDKCGIRFKVIIRTLLIQVLWSRKMAPMDRIKER